MPHISDLGSPGRGAADAVDEVREHPALSWTARLGFACYGLVFLLIGWLALQLAFGDSQGSPSKSGALRQLAEQPFGRVMLWVAVGGFAALVVWELCQLIAGYREREGLKKVAGKAGSAFRAVVFATLAVSAASVASSSGSGSGSGSGSSGGSSQGWTARVLSWPAGPALVAATGVAIVGYAVWSVVEGVTDRWAKELDPDGRTGATGRALTWTARTGYVGRGAAFGAVGGLVVWAALTHDPQKSGGLDGALSTVRDGPAGPFVLALVAIGLACYGVFNLAKVIHLRDASR